MRTYGQFDIMDPRNLEYSFKGNPLKKLEDSVKKTVRNPKRLVTKPIKEVKDAASKLDDEVLQPVAKTIGSKLLPDVVESKLSSAAKATRTAIDDIEQAGEDITDSLTGKMTDEEAAAAAAASIADLEDQAGAMSTTEEEKAEDEEKKKKRARTKKKSLKTKQTTVSGAGLKV
jgi:hypothetical protein